MSAFSEGLVKLVNSCNSFILPGSSREFCKPFLVDGIQVGLIHPDAWKHLSSYRDVFCIQKGKQSKDEVVSLSPDLHTFEEKSNKVAEVLQELRIKDVLMPLRGWRNETYDVRPRMSEAPLLRIERAATSLFGLVSYGTHINGYCYKNQQVLMWIAHRSKTKPTYPGMMDNMCAGGLASGLGVRECAIKECEEEATVPKHLFKNLTQVGCVSYFFEDERGLFPECEFTFDLLLPEDFMPGSADGEVDHFELLPMDKIKELVIGNNFKPNSALIIVDFMIRHGIITMDNEPNFCYLVEKMHLPIQTLYTDSS